MILTYNPSQVQLLVGGYRVEAFHSISIKRDSKAFTIIKGIRGKNTRTRNKDTSCTITVELDQTAPANDVFSEILRQDLETGKARLEIVLKDLAGTSSFSSTTAYIEEYPEVSYSESIGKRTWSIVCLDSYVYVVGGNLKTPLSIFNDLIGGATKAFNSIF